MEYIVSQISLLFSAFVLSLGAFFGTATPVPAPTQFFSGTTTALVTNVIDGDTIDVVIHGTNDPVRVRYIGIDTPEPYATDVPECGSAEASVRNRELVDGQTVTLVPDTDPYDDYNRLLAYVYVGDTFVNETLVAEGFATVLMIRPNTQQEKNFIELFKKAQLDQKGIWAVCE